MPREKRPRPSFSPATPPTAGEPRATTGWVYRSDPSAKSGLVPAEDPARAASPAAARARARHRASKWSTSALGAMSVPFALAIVAAMPWANWLARTCARRRR